jgi:hypothetical protein
MKIFKINGRYVLSHNGELVSSSDMVSGLKFPSDDLIGAAPDLLQAVKVALSHLNSEVGEKEYVIKVLKQALKLAEGK